MRHGRVDTNQPEIVAALRAVGVTVEPLSDVGRGVPDLMCYSPFLRAIVLIELKVGSERLTPAERLWHARWRGPVVIVRNIAEALVAVGVEVR